MCAAPAARLVEHVSSLAPGVRVCRRSDGIMSPCFRVRGICTHSRSRSRWPACSSKSAPRNPAPTIWLVHETPLRAMTPNRLHMCAREHTVPALGGWQHGGAKALPRVAVPDAYLLRVFFCGARGPRARGVAECTRRQRFRGGPVSQPTADQPRTRARLRLMQCGRPWCPPPAPSKHVGTLWTSTLTYTLRYRSWRHCCRHPRFTFSRRGTRVF